MDAQFKKGVMDMCLLASIAQKEQYGYHIIQTMKSHFPEMNESSFYAILRRLHQEGALERFPGTESGGPPRKYYRITETGRKRLAEQKADWNALKEIVRQMGID